MEQIFKKNETLLLILNINIYINNSKAKELAKNLLFIIKVFVTKHNRLHLVINYKRKRETVKNFKKKIKKLLVGKIQYICFFLYKKSS